MEKRFVFQKSVGILFPNLTRSSVLHQEVQVCIPALVVFVTIVFIVNYDSVVGDKDTVAKDVFDVTFVDYEKYMPFIYASQAAKGK